MNEVLANLAADGSRPRATSSVTPASDGNPADWNRTGAEFPTVCTHELFERQVARDSMALAVICGGQRLTYGELNERANQLAHYLRSRGVGPDTLVGVSLHRTPLMVIGLLGVWKAGGAYVPIDPAYPADRLAFMVEDSAVHVLLTDTAAKGLFPGVEDRLVCLDADWSLIERESRENPAVAVAPSNLAYVIYTSGSTGKPKGALIVHSGLVNYLWWAIQTYGITVGDRVPVHSSISFDLTVTSLYPALLAGGHVELLAEDEGARSLVASLRSGVRHGLVKITPAHLELLTHQVSTSEAASMARVFVIGGENLTAESLRFWRDATPTTRLINEYGPTETVVGCCVYEVQAGDPQNGPIPIGRPIANTELYVLDEGLGQVPVGEIGELYIGGAGVARGYLNRPALTHERFLPDPFSNRLGARLYKTGDLARYRPDGILEYLGRVDNQVKLRGYRIELGEIEAALAAQPQVRSSVVVLREDAPGNKQIVAYAVPHAGAATNPADLRRYLSERLPDYMVPAHVLLLEAFPLTQNGKVDRRALPPPTYADAMVSQDFVAPRNDVERRLVTIWTELLKLERIGVQDDIFELGASSLMVIRAVAQIQSAFGVVLEMHALFEHPRIAEMAVMLGGGITAKPAPGATVPLAAPPLTAPPAAVESEAFPIRFGSANRELFGIYQPASSGRDRRECCIICSPFGQEALRSHRVLRILADRLSRSGFHVLRFDYFGTGDSGGADDQADLEGWIGDIQRSHDEVVQRSGCSTTVWFGLRLGATLAALASGRRAQVPNRLVLWDPLTDGSRYLSDLALAHIAGRKLGFGIRWDIDRRLRMRATEESASEALGYPLTPALKAQLGDLSLASFGAMHAENVTLVSAGPEGTVAGLQRQLAASGIAVRTQATVSSIDWLVNDMLNDSMVSADDIRSLVTAFVGAT